MPNITIEYMIMIPLLVLQVFLFPLTASWLMNTWVDSRRTLALQDVAGHLGSTMQQLYFTLNHASIPKGKATYAPNLPPFIEDIHYVARATMRPVLAATPNSTRIIDLTVGLVGTTNSLSVMVVLGPNVEWHDSVFASNSTHACVTGEKFLNGTVLLGFEE